MILSPTHPPTTHNPYTITTKQGGFQKAISKYATNPAIKAEVDRLQMRFECCGNLGYEDWFKVPFIPDDYAGPNQR